MTIPDIIKDLVDCGAMEGFKFYTTENGWFIEDSSGDPMLDVYTGRIAERIAEAEAARWLARDGYKPTIIADEHCGWSALIPHPNAVADTLTPQRATLLHALHAAIVTVMEGSKA